MAVATRQSELFAGQSWTVIYRAFSQINFNASDPPSINAALRNYIQTNYPEDFNDWIEQSEFVAIIDLLSWLAGSLAFKTDIAVRENFIDVAESRASILRLARFLSYNPSRNLAATGVVKIVSLNTDDDVYDSFGTNLNNITVNWNDPDNANWYEQFVTVLNSSFVGTNPFGIPLKTGTVSGIPTQLYRFNGLVSGNNLSFSSTIGGTAMSFEICNGDFADQGVLSERTPNPLNALNIFYLNDGNGNGSARTGFFMLFKQGNSGHQDFYIPYPIANQLLDVSAGNINQTDVWVQTIDDAGNVLTNWTMVPIVLDSNITYNSLPADERNIFSVITQDNDQISIRFSDGLYGNAPSGNMRVSYRVSNGLSYSMKPLDIDAVQLVFAYTNASGVSKNLTITFSLEESVTNATTAETIDDIRNRAPQVYATQNRMVSGEDYNSFPLQLNLARRIKAVNRVYSGQSRYIDLNDPTGTYQDLSLFEEDGIFFKEVADLYTEVQTASNYSSADIFSLFIQPMISSVQMANAVRDLYLQAIRAGVLSIPTGITWNQSFVQIYNTSGYFGSSGSFPAIATNLIVPGAQIQFLFPDGKTTQWATVLQVLSEVNVVPVTTTNGPVLLTSVIPTGSTIVSILPCFLNAVGSSTLNTIYTNLSQNFSFSLTYDYLTASGTWTVGPSVNNLVSPTLVGTTILLINVVYVPGGGSLSGLWQITGCGLDYVFESVSSVEWFDNGARAIDQSTGEASQDSITIMKINPDRNNPLGYALMKDYNLTVGNIWYYEDGTVEPRRTHVSFLDSYGYGYPDQPDTFYKVVDDTTDVNSYLFWYTLGGNVFDYPYDASNTVTSGVLIGYDTDTLMFADTSQAVGTEAFIVSSSVSPLYNNTFWTYTSTLSGNSTVTTWTQDFSQSWDYYIGRGPNVAGTWVTTAEVPVTVNATSNASTMDCGCDDDMMTNTVTTNTVVTVTTIPVGDELAFHWKHYATSDQRIDPSITNIHDIFVLPYAYDTAVRQWIAAGSDPTLIPAPPTELDLRLAFASMENFRMFSDGIVWRPVRYKYLFGNGADPTVQANFKVVRLPNASLADGEIKTNVITAMNNYFDVSFWDFGDTFYFTELAAYIHQQLAGQIASIVIVPTNAAGVFGNEFEIESDPDEILVSTATVANIQIIVSNTPANLRIR